MTRSRLERLRARLAELQVPAALILDPLNVGYLTGFRGNEMGVASALAVMLVVLGLGLALGVQRLGGKDSAASQMEGA